MSSPAFTFARKVEFGEAKEEDASKAVAAELDWVRRVREWVSHRGSDPVIPFSVDYEKLYFFEKEEEELLRWEEEEKRAKDPSSSAAASPLPPSPASDDSSSDDPSVDLLLSCLDKEPASFSPSGSQLEKIVSAGYEHLSLCHFFTCGEDEVKCWTLRWEEWR